MSPRLETLLPHVAMLTKSGPWWPLSRKVAVWSTIAVRPIYLFKSIIYIKELNLPPPSSHENHMEKGFGVLV